VLTALAIAAPLLLGAALFGLLSYGLIRVRMGALVLALLGAVGGGTLAIGVWGLNHTVPGIAVGLFAGTAVALVVTRRPRR